MTPACSIWPEPTDEEMVAIVIALGQLHAQKMESISQQNPSREAIWIRVARHERLRPFVPGHWQAITAAARFMGEW